MTDSNQIIGPGSCVGYRTCSLCGTRYWNDGEFGTRCDNCKAKRFECRRVRLFDANTLIGPGSCVGYDKCNKCGEKYFNPGEFIWQCPNCEKIAKEKHETN